MRYESVPARVDRRDMNINMAVITTKRTILVVGRKAKDCRTVAMTDGRLPESDCSTD